MGQENLSVSQTSIRTDVISTGIHRYYDAPGGILQNQGHQSNILLLLMNTQADALSRSKEPDEWMLAPIVARRKFSAYGLPTIDLFASQRSKQLDRYFSTDRIIIAFHEFPLM